MFKGLVLGLDVPPPRIAASSVSSILPESARPGVLSVGWSGKAHRKREVSDSHELPVVNVVFVSPRHHDRICAIFSTPDSGCGRGVHPVFGTLIPAIASASVETKCDGTLASSSKFGTPECR